MIAFIDQYRDRFSVEFMCQTLHQARVGGFITSRGYRDAKRRPIVARQTMWQGLLVAEATPLSKGHES